MRTYWLPEIALTFVGMQLDLDGHVKEVSMKVAQQPGFNGSLPADVEMNGEPRDFEGPLNNANGTYGTLLTGLATFNADLVQDPVGANGQPSYWWRGKIRAGAVLGSDIQTVTIGAQAAHIDEVCVQHAD